MNLLENLGDQFGGDAQARLVQDEDRGLRHQGPSDGDHLLLPPAEASRLHVRAFAETREQVVDGGQGLLGRGAGAGRVGTEVQVPFRGLDGVWAATLRARSYVT